MKKTTAINIVILLAVGIIAYAMTTYYAGQTPTVKSVPEQNNENTGQPVAEFSFTDIKGNDHNITDFEGKTIMLNFWASWCAPCVKEFPVLLDAAHDNPKDTILIALSSDINEEAIHTFMTRMKKRHAMDFNAANILIAYDKDQAITSGIFQTFKLPETIIIDKALKIRHKFIGANWTAEDLDTTLSNL